MKIILGSGSPRRKNIIEGIFGTVQVISPSVDEKLNDDEMPDNYTERITNLKMDRIISCENFPEECFIITSDTIVSINGKILGKPCSEEDAVSMLHMLSGREHFVVTGLCIAFRNGDEFVRIYDSEKTSVEFMNLDDNTVRGYLEIVDYGDKAGSYAIQEHGEMLVKSVSGSMTNVIGFPLRLFFRMVKQAGAEKILY